MKSILGILSLLFIVSCASTPEKTDTSRRIMNITITNEGYPSAQMSVNQVQATVKYIAALAITGMKYTHDELGNVTIADTVTITGFDYNYLADERDMKMVKNNYSVSEKGRLHYIRPDKEGISVSSVLYSGGKNIAGELAASAVKKNTKPGTSGTIYATGNFTIDDLKSSGSAIFLLVPLK